MSRGFNLNDYVTVDERIDRFWERYPHGAIRTEMLYTNNDGSNVAIKASVHKDATQPHPDATGIAQELQGGANANKSSWWENCETSAIGRALANMGMSISKQRPSREEMAKVQRYQDDAPNRPHTASRAQPPAEALAPAPNGNRVAYNDPRHATEYNPREAVRAELAARKSPPAPLPPKAFESAINQAWTALEDGKDEGSIFATLDALTERMDEAQRLVKIQQVTALQEEIAARKMLPTAGHAG
jgi:hypothetical protein